MPYNVNGITFDGKHSYNDYGMWLSERPDLGSPTPKTNTVEVPGSDGVLDLTEANSGEVKFENRTMVFTFAAMVDVPEQQSWKSQIMNDLHGASIKRIVLDEDPEWYYTGRATVEFEQQNDWKLRVVVTVDANPYAAKIEPTVVPIQTDTESVGFEIKLGDSEVRPSSYEPYYLSRISVGTAEFPSGDISTANSLVITWPSVDNIVSRQGSLGIEIAIFDALHSSANPYVIQPTIASGATSYTIPISDISSSVDVSSIYRIEIDGITNCSAYAVQNAYVTTFVSSGRKTSIIEWNASMSQDASFTVYVNGEVFELQNTDGKFVAYPRPFVRYGENVVAIVPDGYYAISDVSLRYTERKL